MGIAIKNGGFLPFSINYMEQTVTLKTYHTDSNNPSDYYCIDHAKGKLWKLNTSQLIQLPFAEAKEVFKWPRVSKQAYFRAKNQYWHQNHNIKWEFGGKQYAVGEQVTSENLASCYFDSNSKPLVFYQGVLWQISSANCCTGNCRLQTYNGKRDAKYTQLKNCYHIKQLTP